VENAIQILSLFGPPGCGKGTISERLVCELGFTMLSTGNLCRQHIQEGTEFGKSLQKYLDAGHLVPDTLITSMVVEWLKKTKNNANAIILDGYPRTKGQAEEFLSILNEDEELQDSTFYVVDFDVPADEIVQRLSNRLMCSNKQCQAIYSKVAKKPRKEGICDFCESPLTSRSDDEAGVVRERLRVFDGYKNDLLSFYKESGVKLLEFAPKGSPEEVFEDFRDLIDL
jgi:adenylate kinase